MCCISELHNSLYKARIRPRASSSRDTQAAALRELSADSAFDQLGFCSCDVLLLSPH